MTEKKRRITRFLHKKGFTLSEILIAVAIVGILVAVSVPIFSGKIKESRIAATKANIRYAEAAALADWAGQTKSVDERNDNILVEFIDHIKLGLVVYAGEGLYASDDTYAVYLYDAEKNALIPNSAMDPDVSATKNNLYTRIAVKITKSTGVVSTSPHMVSEDNKDQASLVAGFGTNVFDEAYNQGATVAAEAAVAQQNQGGGSTTGESTGDSSPTFGGVEKPTLSTDPTANSR